MGDQNGNDWERDVLSLQVGNSMRNGKGGAWWALGYDVCTKVSGVEVSADWNDGRLEGGTPVTFRDIKDCEHVRRCVHISDDPHVDRRGQLRSRGQSHFGNIEFATEETVS